MKSVVIMFLALLGLPAQAVAERPSIDSLMQDYGIQQAVFVTGKRGAAPEYKIYSQRPNQDGPIIKIETLYSAGSISKAVAAFGVMRLVEDGKITLDSPVNQYLRRWQVTSTKDGDASGVTIRRLLSHMAGINVPGYAGKASVQGDIVASLNGTEDAELGVRIISKPGSAYAYSGGGFSILQLLIEDVSGQSYNQFIRQQFFDPLGMADSGFAPVAGRTAQGLSPLGAPLDAPLFAESAAAGLYSSARDLAAFAAMLANVRLGPLKATTLIEMQTPQSSRYPADERSIQLMAPVEPDADRRAKIAHYGLGLQIFKLRNGAAMIGHSGSNRGFRAMLYAVPKTGDYIVGMVASDMGNSLLAYVLCDWRRSVGGKAGNQDNCPRSIVPELLAAYRAKGTDGFAQSLSTLESKGNYATKSPEEFLLAVSAIARIQNSSDFASERESLLRIGLARFPHSLIIKAELATVLVARGKAAEAQPLIKKILRKRHGRHDFPNLVSMELQP
jgi:CubicO group peptidase (beta-lactamase class C family)